MNDHIFGGWTHDGYYYSNDIVGGVCVKCGTQWDVLKKMLKPFLKKGHTISDIRNYIIKNSRCSVSNKEFKLKMLLL